MATKREELISIYESHFEVEDRKSCPFRLKCKTINKAIPFSCSMKSMTLYKKEPGILCNYHNNDIKKFFSKIKIRSRKNFTLCSDIFEFFNNKTVILKCKKNQHIIETDEPLSDCHECFEYYILKPRINKYLEYVYVSVDGNYIYINMCKRNKENYFIGLTLVENIDTYKKIVLNQKFFKGVNLNNLLKQVNLNVDLQTSVNNKNNNFKKDEDNHLFVNPINNNKNIDTKLFNNIFSDLINSHDNFVNQHNEELKQQNFVFYTQYDPINNIFFKYTDATEYKKSKIEFQNIITCSNYKIAESVTKNCLKHVPLNNNNVFENFVLSLPVATDIKIKSRYIASIRLNNDPINLECMNDILEDSDKNTLDYVKNVINLLKKINNSVTNEFYNKTINVMDLENNIKKILDHKENNESLFDIILTNFLNSLDNKICEIDPVVIVTLMLVGNCDRVFSTYFMYNSNICHHGNGIMRGYINNNENIICYSNRALRKMFYIDSGVIMLFVNIFLKLSDKFKNIIDVSRCIWHEDEEIILGFNKNINFIDKYVDETFDYKQLITIMDFKGYNRRQELGYLIIQNILPPVKCLCKFIYSLNLFTDEEKMCLDTINNIDVKEALIKSDIYNSVVKFNSLEKANTFLGRILKPQKLDDLKLVSEAMTLF